MDSFLNTRLDRLRAAGTFRELPGDLPGVDFWSNDYLGLARVPHPPTAAVVPGATGSRLISGDSHAYHALEARIAAHHGQPAALVFNSGYTANLGLLSALLRRMDTIVYDELSHACCRDGIRLGQARALRFRHNDLVDLRSQLEKARPDGQVFVLTEGRFSMDGDLASLRAITEICEEYG
ncbi:MAG: pyridoxal phosphate-dependent aminotransferase family protein, partial [Bacteroidota bacterium]